MTTPEPPPQTAPGAPLVVVFAPSVWPVRSTLDRLSWLIGQGIARAYSAQSELVGYCTPRSLRTSGAAADGEIRVLRQLPSRRLVVREATDLGAEFVITARLLSDDESLEFWINLVSGRNGDLLFTRQALMKRTGAVWEIAALAQQAAQVIVPGITLRRDLICPTGSWRALVEYSRAESLAVRYWNGETHLGPPLVSAAARALAFDPQFRWALELSSAVVTTTLEQADSETSVRAIFEALPQNSEAPAIRELRREANRRLATLAVGEEQT